MVGKKLLHYKILEKLGAGGMGVVYKAEDTKLKREVAVKVLPQDLTRDEEAKKRFMFEAQAASALDHPNIGTIHEVNETTDGQTCDWDDSTFHGVPPGFESDSTKRLRRGDLASAPCPAVPADSGVHLDSAILGL